MISVLQATYHEVIVS